jgi:hypothetical protein
MNVIFLGLVIWNILMFVATIVTAMLGMRVWHWSLGVLTGIFTCFTHSLIFIQLIGSGKGVKEAVEAYSLPSEPKTGYLDQAKRFKSIAFPYAMYVPMITIITVWLGGWHDTNPPDQRKLSYMIHMSAAWITVLLNLYAFWKEYQVVTDNTRMIREINELIRSKNLQPKQASA